MRVSNHIEIAAKHPRSVQRQNNGLELIKESMSELWRSRGINICNVEGGISNGGGKGNGDGVRSGKGSKVGKKRIRPSNKPPEEPLVAEKAEQFKRQGRKE